MSLLEVHWLPALCCCDGFLLLACCRERGVLFCLFITADRLVVGSVWIYPKKQRQLVAALVFSCPRAQRLSVDGRQFQSKQTRLNFLSIVHIFDEWKIQALNMETNIDKECSAMGAMFQQIITDMKVHFMTFSSSFFLGCNIWAIDEINVLQEKEDKWGGRNA